MKPSIEERLTAVEARVNEEATLRARMDSDQSDLGVEVRATRWLVQRLGLTQNEQTRLLQEQRNTLEDHGRTLADHGRTLEEHSRTLADHTRTLADHTRTLEEHGRTLKEHGRKLDEHSEEFVKVNAKLDLLIELVRRRRTWLWRRR